ncbi:MAG: glycosyl hydrolase, partial [Segetibacter sp.]
MKRRTFLLNSSIATTGTAIISSLPSFARDMMYAENAASASDLYKIFKDPSAGYRPFVRWWWNGDKVEKSELSRELRLLKEAGIGGVEINPVKFPARTDDMGIPSLRWLGDEWIAALQHVFTEAKSLSLTCDLIVGSGWPFGAEYLQGEERAQIVLIGTKKLEGKIDYEASVFDLLKEADPAVSSPYARRKMEILSVKLVPDPFKSMDEVIDLSHQIKTGYITTTIPKGKYVLYALVKIAGFLEVINGAPGADGPVLNHYDKAAVTKYLNHMSDGIQQKIGPLSKHIRAFFTDSMELEGANWTADMPEEFKKRRGYDLMPYLPFTQFKVGSMGNVYDYNYGAELGPDMKNMIQRVRYDFDLTKTELLNERFINTFTKWCRDNNVKSRAQAYGRGYFPLEGSLDMDIPECETWIKAGIGKEMPETDPRVGRGYTMINKFVSSAAHLKGKRLISCEELTNTDVVFNATLELMKVTGDLSTISGVTHPVFHGFNYSPPVAPFPGWIRYGCYLNERNNLWPYFKHFTDYKARISALLQQADMFADLAILPPVADMWSMYGAQNEPFPSLSYPVHLPLVWEAMHQNGNACDYLSETIIRDATVIDGHLTYGSRKYHTIFLVQVESLEPATAQKLLSFVENGGRIFCMDTYPNKSLGWANYQQRDNEVKAAVEKMKTFTDRFIFVNKPEKNFIQWYKGLQDKYNITPYVRINNPDSFVTQVRYQAKGAEILYFINSNMEDAHLIEISPNEDMTKGKQAWIWDAENGERYKVADSNRITLDLGPADSVLVVFDNNKKGEPWKPKPVSTANNTNAVSSWQVEFQHLNGSDKKTEMNVLKDLKELPEYVSFSGTVIYRGTLNVSDKSQV